MAAPSFDPHANPTSAEHQAALRQVSHPVHRTPAQKPNPYVKTFNHWVRRIHLYSGLLLLPWVFLYGVTGFLFNHPSYFQSADVKFVSPAEMQGTALDALPTPQAVATRLVAELNAGQAKPYTLVEDSASYARGSMRVTFTDQEGKPQAWTIDPVDHSGSFRGLNPRTARERDKDKEKAPFEKKDLKLDNPLKEQLAAAAPDVLKQFGYTSVSAIKPEVGALAFRLTDGETTWQASYSESLGTLSGERVRETEAPSMPFRQFLLRMHLTHVYPNEFNIRWIYCVVVDVMSLTMLFWGVSGVIMWLQIKRTRVLGALLLLAALISVAAIGPLMYEAIVSAGR
jgi:hypothetical protein